MVDDLISKYYDKLAYQCRGLCFKLGMESYYKDILHEVLVWVLSRRSYPEIIKVVEDENGGECHFYNLLRLKLKQATIDRYRARRVLFDMDNQYEEVVYDEATPFLNNLSERDFSKFRDLSSPLRSDDFVNSFAGKEYHPITTGYVSGWWHIYTTNNKTYAYWLYSAFWGSRSKGESPKKIKTSTSRHEAYMALCEFNKKGILKKSNDAKLDVIEI